MSTLAGVRAVLFDLDGTLVDTVEDLTASVNDAMARLGRPPRTAAEVRGFIGDGVTQLLRDCLGPRHEGLTDKAVALFSPHYLAHCAEKSALYPGVADTLARLAPTFPLAVVTNKPEEPSRRLLNHLGIGHFFKAVIGGDTLPVKKPDPAPLLEACRRLGVSPAQSVMVGDSPGDVRAAHAAGLKAAGAAYGYRPAAELKGAEALLERIADLVVLL